MIRKISKAIKEPAYAWQVIHHRYLSNLFGEKVFGHTSEFRSDSENGLYAKAVISALRSQKVFENFKRNYSYREILEDVTCDQGREFYEAIRSRNDGMLEAALKSVLIDDEIGNPVKFNYDGVDMSLSPTTLRYVKVASDLKGLFGNNLGRVAEIGCGYGGQTYVNDQLLHVDHATLFDLPFVNQLIERYLNTFLLNGAYATKVINQAEPGDYDLVISNYAFSELPAKLQNAYIKKVVANASRGYLTMNSGLTGERSKGKLSLDELRKALPEFEVYEEEPQRPRHNYLIIWGHNPDFAATHLTPKDV